MKEQPVSRKMPIFSVESLPESSRNKSGSFVTISHQLKTPLAALNIYIGLIQGEAEEQGAVQEFSRF